MTSIKIYLDTLNFLSIYQRKKNILRYIRKSVVKVINKRQRYTYITCFMFYY